MFEWLRRLASRPFRDRIAVYNGVAVRDRPLFDHTDREPQHKAALANAALSATDRDDTVVVVGGGRGVVPTILNQHGRYVAVYEAAGEMCQQLRETRRLNRVYFEIHHAVVGNPGDVYGDTSNARHVANVDDLDGDALVLDCEGAETSILPTSTFNTVVVETHPEFDAPTSMVHDLLTDGVTVAPDPIDGDVVIQR